MRLSHTYNPTHPAGLQAAFRDFALIDHWNAPFAVTLTMKQAIKNDDGLRSITTFLDANKASQNLHHFLNVLNGRVLGKAHTRFGDRLRVIPVIEGGGGKRLHYHVVIDCPRDDLRDSFPSVIDDIWQRTDWGYAQTDIQAGADAGWINYISKFRDKPTFADAIDWLNYHNPDCRV